MVAKCNRIFMVFAFAFLAIQSVCCFGGQYNISINGPSIDRCCSIDIDQSTITKAVVLVTIALTAKLFYEWGKDTSKREGDSYREACLAWFAANKLTRQDFVDCNLHKDIKAYAKFRNKWDLGQNAVGGMEAQWKSQKLQNSPQGKQ